MSLFLERVQLHTLESLVGLTLRFHCTRAAIVGPSRSAALGLIVCNCQHWTSTLTATSTVRRPRFPPLLPPPDSVSFTCSSIERVVHAGSCRTNLHGSLCDILVSGGGGMLAITRAYVSLCQRVAKRLTSLIHQPQPAPAIISVGHFHICCNSALFRLCGSVYCRINQCVIATLSYLTAQVAGSIF